MNDDTVSIYDLEPVEPSEDDGSPWADSAELYERMEEEFRAEVAASLPTMQALAIQLGCIVLNTDATEFALFRDGRWARLTHDGEHILEFLTMDGLLSWSNHVDLVGAIRRYMTRYALAVAQAAASSGYSGGAA